MDAALVLRILTIIIGALGVLGNGLVCVVIAKVPAMRTLTNTFIFNQAVIDFLASVFMVIQRFKTPLPLHENEVVAAIQCHLWHSALILWLLYATSTLNLVMLTFERYLAIVYPFKYLTYFGRKQATVILVGVWVLAIGYKSHILVYRRVEDGECVRAVPSKEASLALGVMTFFLEYFIPLIFMAFCYIHIILQLRKSSSTIQAEPTTSQQDESGLSGSLLRARRNTLKTLFIVFVTYTICWSPNQIAFFLFNFGLRLDFDGAFYIISVALVQLNSCTNPFIYAFKYKQFRKGLRVLLAQHFPKLAPRPDEDTVPTISTRAPVAAG